MEVDQDASWVASFGELPSILSEEQTGQDPELNGQTIRPRLA